MAHEKYLIIIIVADKKKRIPLYAQISTRGVRAHENIFSLPTKVVEIVLKLKIYLPYLKINLFIIVILIFFKTLNCLYLNSLLK